MSDIVNSTSGDKLFLSGNEAVARGVWEAGASVGAAYPGTPSTEILETLALFPDIYSEWSVNEKVALEVAIGASINGTRGFCAMKQVGLNVASDPLMSMTLAGPVGGLVIAVADDIGISSSQNEQDSRYWGRFGHMPVLEPADSQEAYEMVKVAFDLSEEFQAPVLLRLTTRVCHVRCVTKVGERRQKKTSRFHFDPNRWVMTPATAKRRQPEYLQRDQIMALAVETSDLNRIEDGNNKTLGFVTSGPAYLHVKGCFPDAPVLKLGFSYPVPMGKVRELAEQVDRLVIVEETEPLIETEVRAQGIEVLGKEFLPRIGELDSDVLLPALARIQGQVADEVVEPAPQPTQGMFPRPPTMCPGCPHLGVSVVLSRLRKSITVLGDIGCYALASGPPWNSMDTALCMGSSMGIALGVDKSRNQDEDPRRIVGVIGDSTFLHTGMAGLLDIVYNRGNITVIIADNRTVGMTGGQDHPGSGRDLKGNEAPRVDFELLVKALGVRSERVRIIDPYQLPVLFKALREETKIEEPSVLITNQPCVLVDHFTPRQALEVVDDLCTGCGKCLDVGCPIITVTRKATETKKNGTQAELNFVAIESNLCTGCNLCLATCGPDAIVPLSMPKTVAEPAVKIGD